MAVPHSFIEPKDMYGDDVAYGSLYYFYDFGRTHDRMVPCQPVWAVGTDRVRVKWNFDRFTVEESRFLIPDGSHTYTRHFREFMKECGCDGFCMDDWDWRGMCAQSCRECKAAVYVTCGDGPECDGCAINAVGCVRDVFGRGMAVKPSFCPLAERRHEEMVETMQAAKLETRKSA